jgi:SPP1 family predicted phage head-tail adaptor
VIDKLRERVAIQAATVAQDSYGQPIQTWATSTTVWAAVEMMRNAEPYVANAQAEVAQNWYRVRMRFSSTVTVENRLVWRTHILDILGVGDPDGRRAWTEAVCREVVGDTA